VRSSIGLNRKNNWNSHEHHNAYFTHALPRFSSTQLWPTTVSMLVYCTSNNRLLRIQTFSNSQIHTLQRDNGLYIVLLFKSCVYHQAIVSLYYCSIIIFKKDHVWKTSGSELMSILHSLQVQKSGMLTGSIDIYLYESLCPTHHRSLSCWVPTDLMVLSV
jgi:hypothetical protein